MKKLILLSVLLITSGCTTIHFDNVQASPGAMKVESWHHNFALALYEGSEPVDLSKRCQGRDWSSVKTEVNVLNALAAGAVSTAVASSIWYPKSVEVTCK